MPENALRGRKYRPLGIIAMAVIAGLGLSGCKTTGGGNAADPMTTGSLSSTGGQPSLKATTAAAEEWRRDPEDLGKGLAYVRQLELLGQHGQKFAVLKKLIGYHPRNMGLRAMYARALLKGGRAVQAEGAFRAMLEAGQRDWKTYNGLGSALAAQGRFSEARDQYQLALKASPGNVKVMNNIALSHILEGNPARAEAMLRRLLQTPQGRNDRRIRQNLALSLGLQGRFKEARYVASQDLPPEVVEANMAYLRKMLGGSTDTWEKLRKAG